MVLRLNPDEDYRIFRRMEDYSDSLSVFYNLESNFTSTVVYSSKLQLTNETTPGFLRGRHLTMRTYNMLHALYSFQKGCTYIRPSLDADENMKEYYDACFYYNTYIGMCRTIEQQVNPTRSIQFYMMLPTHRDEQRLLRYNADGAHYTTGGDHTPPGTFHLLRATTAKTNTPTRGRLISHYSQFQTQQWASYNTATTCATLNRSESTLCAVYIRPRTFNLPHPYTLKPSSTVSCKPH